MSGDRLKDLEEGFLEGTLTHEEETELKQLVAEHKDHHLSLYFRWTDETEGLDVPDMRQRLVLEDKPGAFWNHKLFKMAASVLLILAAAFIFRAQIFAPQSSGNYSQAEIDESYEATMKTLMAMGTFLNESLPKAEEGMNLSAPFKELNTLENTETQEQ